MAGQQAVTPEVQRFSKRAKVSVLTVEEAMSAVAGSGVVLRSIVGSSQGIIGALAAVGLRAGGKDGRYVDLPGIRDIHGVISVEQLLRETAVVAVVDADNRPLAEGEQIESRDWIRPTLMGGVPVLKVRRHPAGGEKWVPYERRNRSSFTHR